MSNKTTDLEGLTPIHTNFGSHKDDLLVVEYDVPKTKVKQTLFFKHGQLSIPKWALIPAGILAFGLLTALCAIILNSILSQPTAIVTYSQQCSKISKCKDGVGLICGSGARCVCPATQYWYEDKCMQQPTYTEGCNQTTECRTDLGLVCAEFDGQCNCPNGTEAQTCDCPSTSYWTGTMCTGRSGYLGKCNVSGMSYECLYNLRCNGSMCICAPYTQYWNETAKECFTVDKYHAPCNSSTGNSCDESVFLFCLSTGQGSQCPFNATSSTTACDCANGTYWNGGSCVGKKSYGSDCFYECECNTDVGLLCLDLACSCPLKSYWSTSTSPASCVPQKNYGETGCFNSSECDSTQALTCHLSGPQCNCPNTSVTNMCDCLTTQFYDYNVSACQPRHTYNEVCYAEYMCNTTLGLFCQLSAANFTNCSCPLSSALNRCDCNLTSYWDGVSCVSRLAPNMSCTYKYQCQSGYICLVNETDNGYFSDVCRCPIGEYYVNNSGCVPATNYSDTCVGSYQCFEPATLSCRYNYTGLTCLNYALIPACDCPDNYYYNDTERRCLPRLNRYEACTDGCQCNPPFDCTSSSRCDCTFYWSTLSTTCVRYLNYGDACLNSTECAETPNAFMSCGNNNTCVCNSTGYWNGSQCVNGSNFRSSCTGDNNCQGDLRCRSISCIGTGTTCSCPNNKYYSPANNSCVQCDGNDNSTGFQRYVVNFPTNDVCVALIQPESWPSRTFANGYSSCAGLSHFGSNNTPQLISLHSTFDPTCIAKALKSYKGSKKCGDQVYYLGLNSTSASFLDGTQYYPIFHSPTVNPPKCLTVCLANDDTGTLAANACGGNSVDNNKYGYICDYRTT